jgi:hypothetical protein
MVQRNKLVKVLFWLLALVVLAGCRAAKSQPDEAALFRKKHPDEARYYQVLCPAPQEVSMFLHRQYQQEMRGLLKGVQTRKDNPQQLESYLTEMREHYSNDSLFSSVPRSIEDQLKRGGKLYLLKSHQIEADDSRLVVLRDGQIVYCFPTAPALAIANSHSGLK